VPDATEAADRELRRQLATLTYSQVLPALPADAITAAAWWNLVARLGFPLPLVVVHDFGLVLTAQRRGGLRQVRRDLGRVPAPVGRYQALLARVAASEAVTELGAAPLRDDVLAVILARVLGDVYLRWAPRGVLPAELPASSPIYDLDRDTLARAHDPGWSLAFVQRLVDHERGVLARLDQIEAGALRLLGLFSAEGGAADLGDLYQLLGSGTGATERTSRSSRKPRQAARAPARSSCTKSGTSSPAENIPRPRTNGRTSPPRSISAPARTIPIRLPRKKAEKTQPYRSRLPPARSVATIGMIGDTAIASEATIVTLRTSPSVRARRPGDQRLADSGISGSMPGRREVCRGLVPWRRSVRADAVSRAGCDPALSRSGRRAAGQTRIRRRRRCAG